MLAHTCDNVDKPTLCRQDFYVDFVDGLNVENPKEAADNVDKSIGVPS